MNNHHSTTTTTITTTATTNNPYLQTSPAPPPVTASHALHTLSRKFESAAKKAESFAGNLYTHLRTGPGLVDVAMTRIDQAARVITDGGCETVFKKEFGVIPGEKLKKSYVCYLSTTTGPVMGTIYISDRRVGFRSDNPVWTGPGGQWVYYKVLMMVDQILAVNPSMNRANPGEKYIEVLTKDGHEFWFMGFISYDDALKSLYKVLNYYRK